MIMIMNIPGPADDIEDEDTFFLQEPEGRYINKEDSWGFLTQSSPSPLHANFHRKRKHQEIVEDIDSIIRSPAEVGLAGWVRTAIAQCPSLFLLVSC